MKNASGRAARAAILLLAAVGCAGTLGEHLVRTVPPPGGCDRCHRLPISADWKLALSPVTWDRDTPPDEAAEKRLSLLAAAPPHERVPEGRLRVFAAAAGPDAAAEGGGGTRCFVCHRAPDEAHRPEIGTYPRPPHPWVRPGEPGRAGGVEKEGR